MYLRADVGQDFGAVIKHDISAAAVARRAELQRMSNSVGLTLAETRELMALERQVKAAMNNAWSRANEVDRLVDEFDH